MLLEPPIEELVDIVGNKYKLSNLVARRANEIQKKNLTENSENKDNEISVAAKEVYEGTVVSSD